MSGSGFFAINLLIGPVICRDLHDQLTGEDFAKSEKGKFTRLVTLLHKEVQVWIHGKDILPVRYGEETTRTPAMVECMSPYRTNDRVNPERFSHAAK